MEEQPAKPSFNGPVSSTSPRSNKSLLQVLCPMGFRTSHRSTHHVQSGYISRTTTRLGTLFFPNVHTIPAIFSCTKPSKCRDQRLGGVSDGRASTELLRRNMFQSCRLSLQRGPGFVFFGRKGLAAAGLFFNNFGFGATIAPASLEDDATEDDASDFSGLSFSDNGVSARELE